MKSKILMAMTLGLIGLGFMPNSEAITLNQIRALPNCQDLEEPVLSYEFVYEDTKTFPKRGKVDFFRGVQIGSCVVQGHSGRGREALANLFSIFKQNINRGESRLESPAEGRPFSTLASGDKAGAELSTAPNDLFEKLGLSWKTKKTVEGEEALMFKFNVHGALKEDDLAFSLISYQVVGEGDAENLLKEDDHLYVRKVVDSEDLFVLDFKRIIYIVKPKKYGFITITENMFLNGAFGFSGARESITIDYMKDLNLLLDGPLNSL